MTCFSLKSVRKVVMKSLSAKSPLHFDDFFWPKMIKWVVLNKCLKVFSRLRERFCQREKGKFSNFLFQRRRKINILPGILNKINISSGKPASAQYNLFSKPKNKSLFLQASLADRQTRFHKK